MPKTKQNIILLFHGKNTFLSHQELNSALTGLKAKYNKSKTTYDPITFDASTTHADQIINEIETPSFFCSKKLIVLKRLSQNPEKEDLQKYIIAITETAQQNLTTDLLLWEDKKLRSNSRIIKAFKKNSSVWESPELNKRTFLSWAKTVISQSNIDIPFNALHLLSERVNYDPERLTREMDKIRLLGKDTLTEDDIESICPDTLEHSIWELIDMINSGNSAKAGRNLDIIIKQGNDPFFVLLMLTRNLRIILLTKLMTMQRATTSDIARKIKTPPFIINKVKRIAHDTSFKKIKLLYEKLANIDHSAKTGQLDIELALNILLSVI
ncbi:MAG: DNA polymerase III subunit delta [Patescibacteria group bacterium]|nr:DNA polymerase III subunit delta [Patescibacteria group bacterium]